MQPALSLRLNQKVTMTPQLAESIRFLQLSVDELADELRDALENNVMLETSESEGDEPEVIAADEAPMAQDGRWESSRAVGSDDYRLEDRLVAGEACPVPVQIYQQMMLLTDDELELRIALAIIDATEESGYLSSSVAQIACDLDLPADRVEAVLAQIQRLEPVAFASRSLAECLSLQLEECVDDCDGCELAQAIVDHHLSSLGRLDMASLQKALARDEEAISQAVRLIRSLKSRPVPAEQANTPVIPDVVVSRNAQGYVVHLNDGMLPALRINPEYERIVSSDAQAKSLRGQLQEARWLLRSVEMRNDTLLRATQFIFDQQKDFLARGETALRPLTLKFVADAIGVHESTISRITTSKYVQTPHGVYSLKFFFPSQLTTAEGVSSSGAAVKAMIQKLVSNESAEKPLRDVDLAAILARRGVKIARRTIAKYREALGIASSKERTEQYRMRAMMARQGSKHSNVAVAV